MVKVEAVRQKQRRLGQLQVVAYLLHSPLEGANLGWFGQELQQRIDWVNYRADITTRTAEINQEKQAWTLLH